MGHIHGYNPRQWRRSLFAIRGSVAPEILYRVLLFVGWAAAVTTFHHFYAPLGVAADAHALVGAALGLLLVFRTNASYDRFWEGRRQWGNIVNDSRNLARATSAYLAADPALVVTILRWQSAFPWATRHALRGGRELGRLIDGLPQGEVSVVQNAPHPAVAVAGRISELLAGAHRRGMIGEPILTVLDDMVRRLIDSLGACERIHKTPLPFAYIVHLRRALTLYCLALPFALVNAWGWWTIAATFCIAYILFGIDEIGVEIEDPFGDDANDLPLDAFCANIERQLADLITGQKSRDPAVAGEAQ